jgi:hypothetical protein
MQLTTVGETINRNRRKACWLAAVVNNSLPRLSWIAAIVRAAFYLFSRNSATTDLRSFGHQVA